VLKAVNSNEHLTTDEMVGTFAVFGELAGKLSISFA
jgi:hypothetical protein